MTEPRWVNALLPVTQRAGRGKRTRSGAFRGGCPGVGVSMSGRWLVAKVGAAVLTLIFVLIFNFFLFRAIGDPTTQLARLPGATDKEIQQLRERLRSRQAAARPVRRLRRRHRDPRPRDQPEHARAGLGRDQGRAAVDAAARRHRNAAGDADRSVDGGEGGDAPQDQDRRRTARLQPVHLRIARVLDRDHPDPRLRGRLADLPGRSAGDARESSSRAGSTRRSTSSTT